MVLSIKIYLYFLIVNKPNSSNEKGINVKKKKKKGVRKKWFSLWQPNGHKSNENRVQNLTA